MEDVDRAFFEAEIEIEMDFAEPLVVTDGGTASVTVVLDPSFTRPDGSVWDLSAFDYTGDEDDIVEFEAEFEDGVTEIEIDDD